MIKIDKRQRDYLLENGARYGADIHPTHGHHHKAYYLTCSPKMMDVLFRYQSSMIVDTKA